MSLLTSQQIFVLLFTLSSTQNIIGSVSMIRPGISMSEYYKTAWVSVSTTLG